MSISRKTELKRTPFVQKEPAQRKLKPKKCRICATEYQPVSSTSKVCSVECAQGLLKQMAVTQQTRQRRKERAQDKLKLKTRADYFREAQAALNKWIREVRDAGKPCISCGHIDHGQKFDAGHFITRGSRPNLALEENNLARQCHWCNVHLSGNQILFRKGLVARIGLEAVETLEADQTPRKYTIEQLQAIKADYMARIRKAKKENS